MSLYKNKKVVVTGGSGFVGTHFIQELLDRGANVRTSIHNNPLKIQDDRFDAETSTAVASWLVYNDGWFHWNSSKHCWGK